MKIKNVKWIAMFAVLASLAIGCGEDFVTETPKGSVTDDQYYQSEEEAYSGLVAVYDVLRKNSNGFENMISMFNAASDDFNAGGGSSTDGAGIHGVNDYTITAVNIPASYWNDYFQGVARANLLLSRLPGVPMDESTKERFSSEARVLRAYYYFQLLIMFKNVPLITEPLAVDASMYDIPQADPNEVYSFIETEIQESLSALPATITDMASEAGRLSQGSAKAILGKIYLYDHKYAEAAAQLADVNGTPGGTSQYGYNLLANFNDLWEIDNKFNSESILEVSHTSQSNAGWGNWGSGSDEGNSLNVMVGPRSFQLTSTPGSVPQYESGWSFNPPTQALYDAMQGDPRLDATIFNAAAEVAAGHITYSPADQDTGYFLKKFMPTNADISTGGGDQVLNYRQNTYAIRLADTYLMEAEALVESGSNTARAQALLDAVRARVGLSPVTVSAATIANERRLELAGEGFRFFDLVRTGQASAVLGPLGFTTGKNEILPIPQDELSNTQLVQNPNYN